MKPIENLLHLIICPKASSCDQNFAGWNRGCPHADPHDRWEECLSDHCHGFDGVACKEVI
jgi:hypothetical protein